jgi:iron complex outermembrane receptor protein
MPTIRCAQRARLLASVPASIALAATAAAADRDRLEEIVVTAARMTAPLTLEMDARAPRQPVPAHDGADYLKTVPGFSVIRKGGTDGDPVFRGMAASRVNILLDGEQALGGCGMRMDPPTAYVFPEAYDRIVVVKGPQTVLHGPGNSAASVSFERDVRRFDETGYSAYASALGASASRSDLVGDLRLGTPSVYGELTGTRAESDDYEDGAGTTVHSQYERWSASGALGWTPDDATLVELSGIRSDGEAAYADRAMDGVAFDRDNVGLRYERSDTTGRLRGIEAQAYYNYVDHVMDNYSLRDFTPTPTMPGRTVQNPDRRTTGGRAAFELAWTGGTVATLGADLQQNEHSLRATMNQLVMPYESLPRTDDAWFRSIGTFGEVNHPLPARNRLVAGLRLDAWEARDERQTLRAGMAMVPNPTADETRRTTLPSGFLRLEHEVAGRPATLFAGLGHVQRFPDYWELVSAGKESVDGLSAFDTAPEKTTPLDPGVVWAGAKLSASVSAFYSDVDDYILIQSGYPKGMRSVTVTRNVDARTWGGEADATYALTSHWQLVGTLAYTRGENDTDDLPLAQMPPLELRTGLNYAAAQWSAGLLWRTVAEQDRYALRQGNVVGQDLGPTGGFGVLSLNAAWRPTNGVLVSAGVDNLFDKTYAEHLSRSGAMVPGYEQTVRVNEPGRTLWLKVGASFE